MSIMKLSLLGLLASLLCFLGCADEVRGSVVRTSSSDVVGRVVKVSDGDTITVLDSSKTQHKIRLQGIDAPEKSQAFGNASRKFLAGLVANHEVRVAWSKRDRYQRILGTVFVDGKDANLEMLKAGMAWQQVHLVRLHLQRLRLLPQPDREA